MSAMKYNTYDECIECAQELFEDLRFTYAVDWKQGNPSRRIIGFLPIYIPREIIHAAGMLPVGIFGAGDRVPVVHGDAYFQSYICHLPRTVVELALGGYLDRFDGFIFPAICDVIRNLSGIFKLKVENKLIRYLDFPQNFDPEVGGRFYRAELERLIVELEGLNGQKITPEALNDSIRRYNHNRKLMIQLDAFRVEHPHKISAVDFYLIQRAGHTMTVEDHNHYLASVLSLAEQAQAEPEDRIRVVIQGSFCEQPPLGLIKTIENAGCYIVDDDFQLGLRWFTEPINDNSSDPIAELVSNYLHKSAMSSAVYENMQTKGNELARVVADRRADGVIFCAPSFCDPALLDRPLLEKAMNHHHIKHAGFQYHENLGQFHVIKEQAGTFADTIKLWT